MNEEGAEFDAGAADRLRESLHQFANRFSVEIEAMASLIIARTPETKIRHRLTLFRLFSAQHGRDAAIQIDVLAALVDTWALCVQLGDFFENGEGRELFGEHTHLAVLAARRLEDDIGRVARNALPNELFEQARTSVEKVAAQYPILFPFSRQSSDVLLSRKKEDSSLDWMFNASLTPLRAVGGMDHTAAAIQKVAAVADEVSMVVSYLPEQVRLNAQLLLIDVDVQNALRNFDTLAESSRRLSQVAEELPETVSKQITRSVESLDEHREEVKNTLDEVRATLNAVERASGSVGQAGTAWEGTVKAVQAMVDDFSGPEDGPPDPAEEGEPFDIKEYTAAARELATVATKLQGATVEIRNLLTSDTPALTHTADELRGLVNHAATLAVLVVVAIFASALGYRIAVSKWSLKSA